MSPGPQKASTDELNFIKMQIFCSTKAIKKTVFKMSHTRFALHAFDKELVFKLYQYCGLKILKRKNFKQRP